MYAFHLEVGSLENGLSPWCHEKSRILLFIVCVSFGFNLKQSLRLAEIGLNSQCLLGCPPF